MEMASKLGEAAKLCEVRLIGGVIDLEIVEPSSLLVRKVDQVVGAEASILSVISSVLGSAL